MEYLARTETVVARAFSYEVYTGEQKPGLHDRDNSITEKDTAERETIKWLLYFLSKRVKVTMSFVDRFDLGCIRESGLDRDFQTSCKSLPAQHRVQQVAACDPRDIENSTHLIDVSGVPRPA